MKKDIQAAIAAGHEKTDLHNLESALASERQDFDTALTAWLQRAQALVTAEYGNESPQLSVMDSRYRYIRIVRTIYGDQKSVFCFIDRETGDVLKAAGWKRPAKHARGNIFTGKDGITAYGGIYMR
jgi:hypothetical protein